MVELIEKGRLAQRAARTLATLTTDTKNKALLAMADALVQQCDYILVENAKDLDAARESGMSQSLQDRLALSAVRIADMAAGIRQVAALPDPIGEVMGTVNRPNGLRIEKIRVPLGVIGIIYEARPNVTADAAVLCIKSGNAMILRGGKEAIHSNTAIASTMQQAGEQHGLPAGTINLVEDTSRETATALMQLNDYLDVLIPRGGKGLIQSVVKNATVPVIETGTGNCHAYVDDGADFAMAQNIIINGKVSRPSVCNALETVLVHRAVAPQFLPPMVDALMAQHVEVRGCECTKSICPQVTAATQQDWETEYGDYIIAVKVVDDLNAAIDHINTYNTKHSEVIITQNATNAQLFLNEVDAAAVYVNASTRFTDGFEFGLGAEIGISTQKMHARGPMGLTELTSYKYIVYGDGQIRS